MFPCPLISLAGVGPGDQLIVNQPGNSDGSSKLFALTPSSNPRPTACFTSTAASVPNSTLVAFDFSGTAFSPTFETSIFTNQYFFVLPTPAGPSAAGLMWVGDATTPAPDANTVPEPELLPPWPQVAMSGTRENAKFEIAQFIPVGATALGLDPQKAIKEIERELPKTIAIQRPFLGPAATVQRFMDTVAKAKPFSAVGFIGHSVDDSNIVNNQIEIYSVGLLFADQGLVAPPNDDPLFPVRTYANTVITPQIKTQARIVFIGSCFIGPPFKALWNIQDNTVGHVLIVPKGASPVLLGHAITAWGHLLDDLIVRHMNAGAAVNDTNAYLLTFPGVTEQWQVVGDANVKIDRQ